MPLEFFVRTACAAVNAVSARRAPRHAGESVPGAAAMDEIHAIANSRAGNVYSTLKKVIAAGAPSSARVRAVADYLRAEIARNPVRGRWRALALISPAESTKDAVVLARCECCGAKIRTSWRSVVSGTQRVCAACRGVTWAGKKFSAGKGIVSLKA